MIEHSWESVAGQVPYSVAVVEGGVLSPPQLTQWGGDIDAPSSVTLLYQLEDVQITTYRDPPWGDLSPWNGLQSFVESSFGFAWEARTLNPPHPEELHVEKALRGTPRATDGPISETFSTLSKEEIHQREESRQKAMVGVQTRICNLPIGRSKVQVTTVGDGNLWSAGFDTMVKGCRVIALLSGGTVAVESLELEIVANLLDYVRSRSEDATA
jgi:hypothetical protein